jgi:crotonobetainyl-CoA:carnitine CoA-transferase CaiB-like acyl-CoA transferase
VPALGKPGFARLLTRQRKPYRTKDGYACILPYSDRNWLDFYEFTGRNEFKDDPRFKRISDRVQHIATLYDMIDQEARKRTTAEWVAFCDRVSIPCMPVMSLEDLPEDPHVKAVGLFGAANHPTEGRYRTVRNPVSFSGAPFRIRRHAPRLGENTVEVLTEAGLSTQEIEAVVGTGKPQRQETTQS